MQEKKNSAARIRANNRYNEKVYDRINFVVPKGCKERVQRAAEERGASVNSYVNEAVLAHMGLLDWEEKKD